MKKRIVVFGGSGVVGSGIVRALAECPEIIHVELIQRRSINLPSSNEGTNYEKFSQTIVKDMEQTDDIKDVLLRGKFDAAIYTLSASYRRDTIQDYTYTELELSKKLFQTLIDSGIRELHYLSARYACVDSFFEFFRIKGKAEEVASQAGFKILQIYRPGGVLSWDKRGMHYFWQYVFRYLDIFRLGNIETERLGKAIVRNISDLDYDPKEGRKLDILDHPQIRRLA